MSDRVFILGAAKSGTTSLQYLLGQHESVCMSNPKEPIFFEAEYERGTGYYDSAYFPHFNGEKYLCDARVKNLYLRFVARRIYSIYPKAKLIVLLRNPVEVAYSSWRNMFAAGKETLSFDKAIDEDLKRINSGIVFADEHESKYWCNNLVQSNSKKGVAVPAFFRSYIDTGYYDLQIAEYLKYFEKRNLKVFLYEDLQKSPFDILGAIWGFLDLKPMEQGKVDFTRKNVTAEKAVVKKIFSGTSGGSMFDFIGRRNRLAAVNETNEFLRKHFEGHVENLERLIDRDLAHWRN
jgi:hypothetical protein